MDDVEYYIEDNDLVDLLKDVLGDRITDEDIEKILAASEDSEITEEDFDRIVDEILAKSKTKN
jgi:Ca2+-binding EF-hand superfamily protein